MSIDFRGYTSRRYAIVTALVSLLKTIDGSQSFRSNLCGNVYPTLKFIEDFSSFPSVCVTAAQEYREYQSAGFKNRFLDVRIMVFINQENPLEVCESVLEDIETLLEANGRLAYVDKDGKTQYTYDITISSVSSDEGTLDPMSVGELTARVHY